MKVFHERGETAQHLLVIDELQDQDADEANLRFGGRERIINLFLAFAELGRIRS